MKTRVLYAPPFDRIVITNGRAIIGFPRADAEDIIAAISAAAALPTLAATLVGGTRKELP